MYILTMPQIDLSKTPLKLVQPTNKNCGGFRFPGVKPIPAYSPIDLTICGLTALHNGEQLVTDLSAWFIQNNFRIAEQWVYVTIGKKDNFKTCAISEWKYHVPSNNKLEKIFNKNAPFTFRK